MVPIKVRCSVGWPLLRIKETPVVAAFNIPIEGGDLQWLGTLSVLWSQVEYCVEAAIYNVQGLTHAEGRATSLPRDISKKATKLSALVGNHCEGDERKAFMDLCGRIVAVAPLRNLAIHGHWVRLKDHDNAPAAVSWFKVPVTDPIQRLLPAQLPALTVEAGAISRALYDLLHARGAFTYMAE